MLLRTWLLLACLTLALAHGAARADGLRAGAAKADITPPAGYPMWGYGARHDKPSEGVLDPLQARALVLASKEVPSNRNRHSKRPDKPVDRELLVLRVEDADGKPIAHAVNFAAHATMRDAKVLRLSADYPGALAALVEKETGAPCLFL